VDLRIDGPDDAVLSVALAHGAGAGMDTPFMNAIASGLAGRGFRVVRFEFPYMQRRRAEGRRGAPDGPLVLEATWREVIERLGAERLLIGGKSLGGRIASMVADNSGVRGVVCLGYPFHPPGNAAKLRTAHLERLTTPALILQGTRDPFGKPDEVGSYALSATIRIHWIEDGDHSFKPRVRSGRTLEQNLAEAVGAIGAFAASL
jgi:predicted alpha/beta-hydrolase family hydrolase